MNVNALVQKTKFQLKAHSPEILVVSGVVGLIASTVLACRATIKAKEVIDKANEDLDQVAEYKENGICDENTEYTEEMAHIDTVDIRRKEVLALTKLYVIPVGLGVLSLACILKSHGILRDRNSQLAAAYMAVDNAFKGYRKRVAERFGDEVDKQLLHNVQEKEIEEKTTDSKGNEKIKKKKICVADPNAQSEYVKYFTRSNPNWSEESVYNERFFALVQHAASERLIANGHLTLNEVFDFIGFQHTKAGMVVGWIYDPKNPIGDNQVIFDICEVCLTDEEGNFDHGYAIDFNVDGNIYNYMA